MKLLSRKQRERDVLRTFLERKGKKKYKSSLKIIYKSESSPQWKGLNDWIKLEKSKGLQVAPCSKANKKKGRNFLEITLPSRMDFFGNYDSTVQTLTAIRKLSDAFEQYKGKKIPSKAFKIGTVCFDHLSHISTSAALVLTAEMSKWDTSIRNKLRPQVEGWSDDVYRLFDQLGFFDLFDNKPQKTISHQKSKPNFEFVRYVKGCCGDVLDTKEKRFRLKNEVMHLVGTSVPKWMILHSGISEAVTNVTHHAYPERLEGKDKSWYLTGSFDRSKKILKIAFYDQGIGIPNSLPESGIWEKVVAYFSSKNIVAAERKRDEMLIKAAVSVDRTSTNKNDRGKGLQDLIEFIRQLGSGYLSIMSYKGLFKCTINSGKEKIKSENFDRPLLGTLIIWSVKLDETEEQ